MSFQDYQGILGIVGGIIGVCVAVATYFRGVIQQNQKIHEMEVKQIMMETRFNVFWTVIEKELPKILIRPHTQEIDSYLRKMQSGECLTSEEKKDIVRRMREIVDNPSSIDDKVLVSGYIWVIARFESELAAEEKQKEHESQREREQQSHHRRRWF